MSKGLQGFMACQTQKFEGRGGLLPGGASPSLFQRRSPRPAPYHRSTGQHVRKPCGTLVEVSIADLEA